MGRVVLLTAAHALTDGPRLLHRRLSSHTQWGVTYRLDRSRHGTRISTCVTQKNSWLTGSLQEGRQFQSLWKVQRLACTVESSVSRERGTRHSAGVWLHSCRCCLCCSCLSCSHSARRPKRSWRRGLMRVWSECGVVCQPDCAFI